MMNDKVINIVNLEIGYGKQLCKPINKTSYAGDCICIAGKNGTGKSTFLKTLSGIIKPLSGSIFYKKIDLNKINLKTKSKFISFVPSKLSYFSNLKVYDLIAIGRTPYTNIFDKLNINDLELIDYSISLFGLKDLKNKSLYEISDGERQKAMICRAFVQNTPVILLDEPTAFLDYPSKVELLRQLKYLCDEKGKTIIFSSHDLELALKNANKAWIFNENNLSEHKVKDLANNNLLKSIFSFESNLEI